jgi:hypothetical protein
MLSPVVVPKPKRLLSPKTGFDLFEDKKQDSGEPTDKMFTFDSRVERSGGVHEASLEVERILLALEDAEKDQKSPLLPENPRDTYVEDPQYSQYSPPLRPFSPPARSQNPQAEAIEALYSSKHDELDSDECLPPAGQPVFDDFSEAEDEMAYEQFQQMSHRPPQHRPQFQSLTEPSSPYSAPPFLPSPLAFRRNSIPGEEEDEHEEIDIVFISPPGVEDYDGSAIINEDSPDHLPQEPGSCPLSISTQGSGPMAMMSMRRFQSLPGSGAPSGPPSMTNSSKRKRGKPKYESRSLPISVGCDLVLTMQRRQVRTMSATEGLQA